MGDIIPEWQGHMQPNGKCECGLEASYAAPEAHERTCSYRLAREAEEKTPPAEPDEAEAMFKFFKGS